MLDACTQAALTEGGTAHRKASIIEEQGRALLADARYACTAGIHLLLLTNDKGVELVARRHSFEVIA